MKQTEHQSCRPRTQQCTACHEKIPQGDEPVIDAWNAEHPPSTVGVVKDDESRSHTGVQAYAHMVFGAPITWKYGVSGCYRLDRLTTVSDILNDQEDK